DRSIGTDTYKQTSPEEMLDRIDAWMYGEQPRQLRGLSVSGDAFPLEVKEGTVSNTHGSWPIAHRPLIITTRRVGQLSGPARS
ncbi:MAG: hypothetical protein KGN76_13130, partial [Acidobacteriota bacterium]|nr:hypothetical protein [Acidobacteriota bacterium]